MSYGIMLEVWGEYASFNRPEMKVERVSYEVMTPSAARGFLEAIYWKPQMRWVIDRIHVLAPIKFSHVRRNEIDSRIPVGGPSGVRSAMKSEKGDLGITVSNHRQQRAAMILSDVRYGIVAHVEVLDAQEKDGTLNPHAGSKHVEAFRRRVRKGQYFHHPYLGCREFPGSFQHVDSEGDWGCPKELEGQRSLGFMLWDMEFVEDEKGAIVESNRGRRLSATARFFDAMMTNGVLEVPPLSETRA